MQQLVALAILSLAWKINLIKMKQQQQQLQRVHAVHQLKGTSYQYIHTNTHTHIHPKIISKRWMRD